MGNYGFTPFGIHKESTGEDGVLFHLGPENKEFYTWDNPKYNAINHNSEVFHNVLELISDSELFELQSGDAMFIPHYVYHVANTPKFSVSFVLDYINPPKDRFENNLIEETGIEKLIHKNEYEKPIIFNSLEPSFKDIIDFKSIQKKIEITLARKIMAIKSNGGIFRKSINSKIRIPQTVNFSIVVKKIFPIYVDTQELPKIILFARGHRILMKQNDTVITVVEKLNTGKSLSFSEIKQLLEPTLELIDIYGFIQELLSTDAIVICK